MSTFMSWTYVHTLVSIEISNAGAFTTYRQAGGIKRALQDLEPVKCDESTKFRKAWLCADSLQLDQLDSQRPGIPDCLWFSWEDCTHPRWKLYEQWYVGETTLPKCRPYQQSNPYPHLLPKSTQQRLRAERPMKNMINRRNVMNLYSQFQCGYYRVVLHCIRRSDRMLDQYLHQICSSVGPVMFM